MTECTTVVVLEERSSSWNPNGKSFGLHVSGSHLTLASWSI